MHLLQNKHKEKTAPEQQNSKKAFLEYVKLNIVYVHLWSTFIYMQYNSLPHNSFGFKNSADVATEVISKVTPWHYESESLFA